MNKYVAVFKRATVFVLCMVIIATTGIFPQARAQTLEGLKDDYNKLQQEMEENRNKLEKIESQMASNEDKLIVFY